MTEPWVITVPAWVAVVIPVAFLVAVIAAGWRAPPEECQREHVDEPPTPPQPKPPLRLEDVPTNDLSRHLDLEERTRQIGPERWRATVDADEADLVVLPSGAWDPTVRKPVARVHASEIAWAARESVRDEERRAAGGGT